MALTIDPNVTLHFDTGNGLFVDGTLVADGGSPGSAILLTSSSFPGAWIGVHFRGGGGGSGGGTLRYATVEYAGAGFGTFFGIRIDTNGTATLDHVTVRQTGTGGNGVELRGSAWATLRSLALSNNAGSGLFLSNGLDCDLGASAIDAPAYTGNGSADRIRRSGGTLAAASGRLRAYGVPYFVSSSITVASGATLTVDPGVTLALNSAQGLFVDGITHGHASSSPSTPIVVTTANAAPAPGQWVGVHFRSGSSGTLRHATVRFAGSGSGTTSFGIRIDTTAPLTWDHVTLDRNAGSGLDVEIPSANVTIKQANFTNAPGGNGVTNSGTGGTVNASGSWWGSATGPTIASNPGGTGDAVAGSSSAGVNLSGFTSGPN